METIKNNVENFVMSELGLTLTDLFKKESIILKRKMNATIRIHPPNQESSSKCDVEIAPNTEIILSEKDSIISGMGYTNKIGFQLKCLKLETGYQYAVKSSFIVSLKSMIEALK